MPQVQDRETTGPMRPDDTGTARPPKRYALGAILAVVLVAGAVGGVRYVSFARTHVSTDDAYIKTDFTQIAPQVAGTVKQVLVTDNQEVKPGDLLVVLDDSTLRANVDQAKANLQAAIAQAQGAGLSVKLTGETGGAQVLQAQAGVSQADSSIQAARSDVARAEAGIANAQATATGADAAVGNARETLSAAQANRQRCQDAVASAEAQVESAKAAVAAAQSNADAAKVVADRQARDAKRYTALVRLGATSEQVADQAVSAAEAAEAQYRAATRSVTQAQAVVAQRAADVSVAREQLNAAIANIGQAKAGIRVAEQQKRAAQAGVQQARAAHASARQNVTTAAARRQQAFGQLVQAQTTPHQVAVSESGHSQANAKIQQARAALEYAEFQLSYTRIYAPIAGRVNAKSVQVGQLVQPGTPLMALVPLNDVWISANYKETQLTEIRPGQEAEVEVDALPGKTFKAHVDSIASGTGSTFALLPPDNATGNFNKVVQRVPTKLVIDAGQPNYDRLRAGMSVVVTIRTK